jgi:tRNA/tmRNA/rRNA uracil-C5-methylase (TrmA/RlmC/RlmD family)
MAFKAKVEKLVFGGAGLVRSGLSRRVAFVPFTAPGDEVTANLISLHCAHF